MTVAGVRVLELATGAAAPFAGRMLATFGADVIKVEFLPEGDWTRRKLPLVDVDGHRAGALFHFVNAGKRSVAVTTATLADVVGELWRWSDVVLIDEFFLAHPNVESLRSTPGPSVVTIVTPFGITGPDAGRPGTASTAFARCSEGSITPGGIGYQAFPDRPPLVARGKLADFDTGVIAAMVSMASLPGDGDRPAAPHEIDVPVYETQVSHNRWIPSSYARTGWIETRASKPYPFGGMMPCKDGYAMFLPSTDRIWANFIEIMGRPEWALDDGLQTREGRIRRADDVRVRIIDWAADVTRQELLDSGLSKGVPLGPYRSMHEVAECPHFNERGFYADYGSAKIPGLPAPGLVERLMVAPHIGDTTLRDLSQGSGR